MFDRHSVVCRTLLMARLSQQRSRDSGQPRSLSDLPRSGLRTQPGVLTPGTHPTRRVALKGRKVKFGITSEYGLARHTTRSLVMDLGQDKRTILFDAIASYASFYRALSAVCPLLFLLHSWSEQEIDNIADVLFIG